MDKVFILYREGARVVAAIAPVLNYSDVIEFQGIVYRLVCPSLGDFNHLLSRDKALVGFEFPFWSINFKELCEFGIIKNSLNTKADQQEDLRILLADSTDYASDLGQVLGCQVFASDKDAIILVHYVTEWQAWSSLGFPTKEVCFGTKIA
jgi:hypothetical protein